MYTSLVSSFPPLEYEGVYKGEEVDRKGLGEVVFSNQVEMRKLESAIWPILTEDVNNLLIEIGGDLEARVGGEGGVEVTVVMLEGAVLERAGWDDVFCDDVWEVNADEDVRVGRVMERDGVGEVEARIRVEGQGGGKIREGKYKSGRIEGGGNREDTEIGARRKLEDYLWGVYGGGDGGTNT
ncbi:hypothetical protein TrCOL_g8488 [Triparma columacea]|uniref:Uncharacterized protein n=1 Tax=Triparma columacea TaxID=722753 RepID=A0A9W7GDD2_9STRA|nr:hypothetical protein TrCOL_g8488 [Triparma columacea]